MKLVVETYKTSHIAHEKRQLLSERGIESRMLVDPLEGRYPALAQFSNVAVAVAEARYTEASQILDVAPRPVRCAS